MTTALVQDSVRSAKTQRYGYLVPWRGKLLVGSLRAPDAFPQGLASGPVLSDVELNCFMRSLAQAVMMKRKTENVHDLLLL